MLFFWRLRTMVAILLQLVRCSVAGDLISIPVLVVAGQCTTPATMAPVPPSHRRPAVMHLATGRGVLWSTSHPRMFSPDRTERATDTPPTTPPLSSVDGCRSLLAVVA